ncbi:MAG TPA: DUF2793 domain-containing protein [Xanthobacteraceae bacterium]|nr:DUF2793 domain-containing protein [Xanthobacteraceae bacterium]
MTETIHLGLPFIAGGQAQKHVTHNEALRILDATIQIAVKDMARTTPPPDPQPGDRYIVAAGGVGAWAGCEAMLAAYEDGAWRLMMPKPGWCAWSVADRMLMAFDGTAWRSVAGALDDLPHLGINTAAFSPNLLSVRSNAALLTAIVTGDGGSGDARLQVSKQEQGKTASVVFSSNYSGRAEFGLVGDDAFRLKTSPDGAQWRDAFSIDPASGRYAMPADAATGGGLQVNGAMEISQEFGNSAVALNATAVTQTKYVLDGVSVTFRGSFAVAAQQATSPFPGTAKALRIDVTTPQPSLATNDELCVALPVEGTRAAVLEFGSNDAMPLSVGFWFMAHRPGTYSGAIRNPANNRSYPFSFTVASSNVRQWITLSGVDAIPGDRTGTWPAGNVLGLTVTICLGGGASRLGPARTWSAANYSGASGSTNGVAAAADEFYISNVIMLPGLHLPIAERAAFVMRPLDHELMLCKRYWEKSYPLDVLPGAATMAGMCAANASSATMIIAGVRFVVEKRSTAGLAVTIYSVSGTAGRWSSATSVDTPAATVANLGTTGFGTLTGMSSLTVGANYCGHYVANCRL